MLFRFHSVGVCVHVCLTGVVPSAKRAPSGECATGRSLGDLQPPLQMRSAGAECRAKVRRSPVCGWTQCNYRTLLQNKDSHNAGTCTSLRRFNVHFMRICE